MTLGSLYCLDVVISFAVGFLMTVLSLFLQLAPQVKTLHQVQAGNGWLKQIRDCQSKNLIYKFSYAQIKLYCTMELQKCPV